MTKKKKSMPRIKLNLTIKQQRFVDKYEGKGSVRTASKYAGITYNYGRQLLTLPHIKSAIEAKQTKLQRKVEVDQEWLLKRYKLLCDYRITDFFDDNGDMKPLSQIPEEAIYAICGLDVYRKTAESGTETFIQKFKLTDKKASLDSIMNMLGLSVPKKHEHTGKDGGPIETKQIKELSKEELLKIASEGNPIRSGT